jgi:6-hydroxycyclohex-1-ene-1-carbonyl-CoA dehydrogenase
MAVVADAWILKEPKSPLERGKRALPDPGPTEAIVEVMACGLCHTDLAFALGSVAPRHPLPLVLGHEIVGTVVEAGSGVRTLVGQRVLVPAVLPCGDCAFCRAGRGNACAAQKMPGNDIDGGFASHVLVPAAPLVALDEAPRSVSLDALAVVADAVSTAYQAVRRSGLGQGDVAFVVGAGGVGGYVAQIAKALGARVVACDVDPERSAALAVDRVVGVRDRDARDVKKELHALARDWRVPSLGWRIFECSGTASGQLLAYALLGQAATLAIVGYTREPVSLRLSSLMAFDATAFGSWGCPPEAYGEVLALIYDGKVAIEPFIERGPMSRLDDWLQALAEHRLPRRMVLDPRT